MKTFNRTGQLFSGDLAIASMIYLTALAMVFFLWNSTTSEIAESENLKKMQSVSSETLEQLIRTPGVPEDWNRFTVLTLGLASLDRQINSSKAAEFIVMMNATNYELNLNKLGLGGYQYYLNVTDISGNPVSVGSFDFVAGLAPNEETDAITIFRTAIYNETTVRLTFTIWK